MAGERADGQNAFYFDGGVKDNWLIIDGLQRITALKEFVIDGKLALSGLEFFSDLEERNLQICRGLL
ncbi:MAG: hypothetical protein HFH94_00055 [Lachnospiraceae bacterium]|nr:hypothetical protein [Lachnospiraceae bacterium]